MDPKDIDLFHKLTELRDLYEIMVLERDLLIAKKKYIEAEVLNKQLINLGNIYRELIL